jgi:hypothetical protein
VVVVVVVVGVEVGVEGRKLPLLVVLLVLSLLRCRR